MVEIEVEGIVLPLATNVCTHLQRSADPELCRSTSEYKIASLEHITDRPQDYHANAHAMSRFVIKISNELWCTCGWRDMGLLHCFNMGYFRIKIKGIRYPTLLL